jgi:hypothetical protein
VHITGWSSHQRPFCSLSHEPSSRWMPSRCAVSSVRHATFFGAVPIVSTSSMPHTVSARAIVS